MSATDVSRLELASVNVLETLAQHPPPLPPPLQQQADDLEQEDTAAMIPKVPRKEAARTQWLREYRQRGQQVCFSSTH